MLNLGMFRDNFNANNETDPCNPFRTLELILCCIAAGLAIYILMEKNMVHPTIAAILILAAVGYTFITLIDVVLTCLLRPFPWASWIMLSVMGALAFFLCTGLAVSLETALGIKLFLITLTVNGVIGIIFLIDTFYVIMWLVKRFTVVEPLYKKETVSVTSESECTVSTSPGKHIVKYSDKAIQFSGESKSSLPSSNDKSIQCTELQQPKKGKFTCAKEQTPKRFSSIEVPSHGGTFHVSRDVAPILNPSPVRPSKTEKQISRSRSPSVTPEGVSMTVPRRKSAGEGSISPTSTRMSRTVSISVRTVPKRSDTCLETKRISTYQQDYCLPCHYSQQYGDPQPSNEETTELRNSALPPKVNQSDRCFQIPLQYYNCKCMRCCADSQPQTIIKPITHSHSKCCQLPSLPTVKESESYDLTEEPTKEYSSPLSSPQYQMSPCKSSCESRSAKSSKASRVSSAHTESSRSSSSRPSSRSASRDSESLRLFNQPVSMKGTNTLEKPADNALRPTCVICKCNDPNFDKESGMDPIGGKAPLIRPCAVFSFEPDAKNQQIQTEINQQSRATSCAIITDQPCQVEISGKRDEETKSKPLIFRSTTVDDEVITLLPGEVQCSASVSRVRSMERYVVLEDDSENPCVIAIPRNPTKSCLCSNTSLRRRRKGNCRLM